jgi:hypothetical protein
MIVQIWDMQECFDLDPPLLPAFENPGFAPRMLNDTVRNECAIGQHIDATLEHRARECTLDCDLGTVCNRNKADACCRLVVSVRENIFLTFVTACGNAELDFTVCAWLMDLHGVMQYA